MTALQTEVKPLLCEEGHLPDFEMVCEIPDTLQGVFGLPATQKRWVCIECYNTKEYFQKFSLPGTKKELVSNV